MTDQSRRFSERAESYSRYRPRYPPGVLEVLASDAGVAPGGAIADVGSGTGILAEALLQGGYRVFGVEPNEAMRVAAERALVGRPRFCSVPGRAESTLLPARSVDAVVAAQSFHWFDVPAARAEFARILRPGGAVLLVWNVRREDASPLMRGYQAIVRSFAIDPVGLDRHDDRGMIAAFFGPAGYRKRVFSHADELNRVALLGRASSATYMPGEGHPRRAAMIAQIEALFDRCSEDGLVRFDFDTHVYFGVVGKDA